MVAGKTHFEFILNKCKYKIFYRLVLRDLPFLCFLDLRWLRDLRPPIEKNDFNDDLVSFFSFSGFATSQISK